MKENKRHTCDFKDKKIYEELSWLQTLNIAVKWHVGKSVFWMDTVYEWPYVLKSVLWRPKHTTTILHRYINNCLLACSPKQLYKLKMDLMLCGIKVTIKLKKQTQKQLIMLAVLAGGEDDDYRGGDLCPLLAPLSCLLHCDGS